MRNEVIVTSMIAAAAAAAAGRTEEIEVSIRAKCARAYLK
jgi:hypothetical protein